MKKEERIVRYTADELRELVEREGTQTDWARVKATTQEELEAAIASDPDDHAGPIDWSTAMVNVPKKGGIFIRLDPEVLAYFRAGGPGYQTRINAVLRTYVEQMSKKPAKV